MQNVTLALRTASNPLASRFLCGIKLNRLAAVATRKLSAMLALLALAVCALPAFTQTAGAFKVTNLVSDGSVPATTTDANFINPWGISVSSTWWINANGTGFSYVVPSSAAIPFKVGVPAASGATTATGTPTGSVTTAGTTTGFLLPNGTKASFIFSSLDGIITGWNSKLGTANAISQVAINNSAAGAVYTGLAMLTNTTGSFLLAPNFGKGNTVEVYDSNFAAAHLAGSFTDPNLPSNYSPYSVHVINGQVYVAYAVRTASAPYNEVLAPGNGILSLFDSNGNFISRVVTGGNLNAPWGVAIAPASFGIYGNDILIGNFGDGTISVYDPKTFAFLGQLTDGTGKVLVYPSLWDILPGASPVNGSTTAVSGGTAGTVYFTAGLSNEAHGLLAGISNDTSAGTPAFALTSSSPVATVTAGGSAQVSISVAPTNSFSGTVTLACSGLPVGATCNFSPTQLSVSSTASSIAMVTIQTASNQMVSPYGALRPQGGHRATGIATALLLPFASLLLYRRRNHTIRVLGLLCVLAATTGLVIGCSSYKTPANMTVTTPGGQSNIIVSATSGTLTQQTAIALTVK